MTLACILLSAISLGGPGRNVEVAASVGSNNVTQGDLVSLSLEFRGMDDAESLAPPRLAKAFDAKEWRVDDATAKAETGYVERQAFLGVQRIPVKKTLVYSLRPVAPGVLTIPALEFTYTDSASGKEESVSTAPIPVRVKPGKAIAAAAESAMRFAMPDGIVADLVSSRWNSAAGMNDDDLFAWRKACADPTPGAFAKFDFPEARLNEAASELMTNNWARALEIYSKLEWSIGQCEELERGMKVALAQRAGVMKAELPLWRRALRPVLKFALFGRCIAAAIFLALVALALWLIRRSVRSLAAVALVFAFAEAAFAQARLDPFAEMERMRKEMDEQMNAVFGMGGMMGGLGGGGMRMTINGQAAPEVNIKASVVPDKSDLTVGENFNFILSLEMPKSCTVQVAQFAPSRTAGWTLTGKPSVMADAASSDTNSVVRRISIPVRYDAPFEERLSCSVGGMYTCRIVSGRSSSTFSQNFSAESAPVWMKVKPLPGTDKPADYTGVVAGKVDYRCKASRTKVATNDVVVLDCRLTIDGYIPPGAVKGGTRTGEKEISFKKYFVADGSPDTGKFSFSWYDPEAKDFKRLERPGVKLTYVPDEESEDDAAEAEEDDAIEANSSIVELKFSPREDAPAVGAADALAPGFRTTESLGAWVRVDDGEKAGWVKKEDLP